MRLIEVEWIDAGSLEGWVEQSDIDKNLSIESMLHRSVGWVILEDGERLIIAGSRADSGDKAGEVIAIPKVAVRGIYTLARNDQPSPSAETEVSYRLVSSATNGPVTEGDSAWPVLVR